MGPNLEPTKLRFREWVLGIRPSTLAAMTGADWALISHLLLKVQQLIACAWKQISSLSIAQWFVT